MMEYFLRYGDTPSLREACPSVKPSTVWEQARSECTEDGSTVIFTLYRFGGGDPVGKFHISDCITEETRRQRRIRRRGIHALRMRIDYLDTMIEKMKENNSPARSYYIDEVRIAKYCLEKLEDNII